MDQTVNLMNFTLDLEADIDIDGDGNGRVVVNSAVFSAPTKHVLDSTVICDDTVIGDINAQDLESPERNHQTRMSDLVEEDEVSSFMTPGRGQQSELDTTAESQASQEEEIGRSYALPPDHTTLYRTTDFEDGESEADCTMSPQRTAQPEVVAPDGDEEVKADEDPICHSDGDDDMAVEEDQEEKVVDSVSVHQLEKDAISESPMKSNACDGEKEVVQVEPTVVPNDDVLPDETLNLMGDSLEEQHGMQNHTQQVDCQVSHSLMDVEDFDESQRVQNESDLMGLFSVIEPPVFQPSKYRSLFQPPALDPSFAQPSVIDTSITQTILNPSFAQMNSVLEPSFNEPPVLEPSFQQSAIESSISEPTVVEPDSQPVDIEPSTIEPSVNEFSVTQPSNGELSDTAHDVLEAPPSITPVKEPSIIEATDADIPNPEEPEMPVEDVEPVYEDKENIPMNTTNQKTPSSVEKVDTEREKLQLEFVMKQLRKSESLVITLNSERDELVEQIDQIRKQNEKQRQEMMECFENYRQAKLEVRNERLKAESITNQWRFYRNSRKQSEKRTQRIVADIDTFLASEVLTVPIMRDFMNRIKRRLLEDGEDEDQDSENDAEQ